MPRSPTTYFLPPGTTPQVPDTPIPSATFNAAMNDIAATFNVATPTAYGGTGGTSITTGYDGLNARGANIATASSINLSTATGPNLHLTGTTTVATVTLAEGNVRQVIADAAFQLTASANLIVNGSTSVNYTTTPRTNLLFIGDAAGVVYVWALGGAFLPLSGGTLTGALTVGGILGLGSTGQVQFPATQNPSPNANTLDDYEEGTFTPAFVATGSTFSYATQIGLYTKVGNTVSFVIVLQLNTSGNTLSANNISLSGLPFAPTASVIYTPAATTWSQLGTAYVVVVARAESTTAMSIRVATAATQTLGFATAANFLHATNGSLLAIGGNYLV